MGALHYILWAQAVVLCKFSTDNNPFSAFQIVMNLLLFFVLINKKISLCTSSSGKVRIELFLSKTTYKIWFKETASTPGSERASNNKGLFAWESEPP